MKALFGWIIIIAVFMVCTGAIGTHYGLLGIALLFMIAGLLK